MNFSKLLLAFLFLVSISFCNTKKETKDTVEKVFGSFIIALGENPNNKVQCVANFKKDDKDGDHISLNNSTSIQFDSFNLSFDSVYFPQYDTEIDTSYFLGRHTWNITNNNKVKQYHFESKPFKIISEIPQVIGKNDIIIKCESLQSTDKVTMLISGDYTDNSETIIDINPNNGYFIISKSILDKIEGTNLLMYFNLSSVKNIPPDDFLTAGGILESTRVSKQYKFQLIR
jgi:hypothetical protein